MHEAGHIDNEIPPHLQQLAAAAVHGQREGIAGQGAVANIQGRGALARVLDDAVVHKKLALGNRFLNMRIPGLNLIQCGSGRRGDDVDNHIRHVRSRQVAAKAKVQYFSAEKVDGSACLGAQRCVKRGHGVIHHRLHLRAGHVRTDLFRGDRLAVMADVQRVRQIPCVALQGNGLHLARARLTLGHVQRLHHPEFKITIVAGNVCHVRVRKIIFERQLKDRPAPLGLGSVDGHCDVARAKKSIHGRLQIGLQRRGGVTVGNGVAEPAIARAVEHGDLEAAAGQRRIYNCGHHLKDTHSHKGAVKSYVIPVHITANGDRPDFGQSAAVACSRSVQRSLQISRTHAQGQLSGCVVSATLRQSQLKAAVRCGITIHHNPLHGRQRTVTIHHRPQRCTGVAQTAVIKTDRALIRLAQRPRKKNIQTQLTAVRLRRVVAHHNAAGTHRAQTRKLALHPGRHLDPVRVVGNVPCGLATKA